MKLKHGICLVGLLALVGLGLNAQQQGGGYKGPGAVAITVAEAKNLRDDTPVILQGKIERFLGDEKYLFSDDTGNMVIEIDSRVWGNLSVDENEVVEINGDIDKEFSGNKVEVRTIRKI
ncbi:MAG: NirD/YgiW/YdeI family stress tolerance protein [Tannerella sp.]|nr:NirD/YgiW/YdeI family stress tolerance protein [Tannerella sp.]